MFQISNNTPTNKRIVTEESEKGRKKKKSDKVMEKDEVKGQGGRKKKMKPDKGME